MAECMTLGVKRKKENTQTARVTYIVLDDRPATALDGYAAAKNIKRVLAAGAIRQIEDPPLGGSAIRIGDDKVGEAIQGPLPQDDTWDICRVSDLSLAQAAWLLIETGKLWLPGMAAELPDALPLRCVNEMVAQIGPYHADINWSGSGGKIRGPFKLQKTDAPGSVTYPILWSHDADRERSLCFEADHEGIVRPGRDAIENRIILDKVNEVRATASHLHFNRDFRFNSQSTAMQYTRRLTIGGQAWLTLKFPKPEHEAAVVLWANSSLGLLLHWWQVNKQQSGRGRSGKEGLNKFALLDPAILSKDQLSRSAALLESCATRAMLPLNEIDVDSARAALDKEFLVGIMELPAELAAPGNALELLRRKLAQEPSVHGGKTAAGKHGTWSDGTVTGQNAQFGFDSGRAGYKDRCRGRICQLASGAAGTPCLAGCGQSRHRYAALGCADDAASPGQLSDTRQSPTAR